MQRTSLLCGVAALALGSASASAVDKAVAAGPADSIPKPVGRCPGGILPVVTGGVAADAVERPDRDIRPGEIVVSPADLTDDGIIDYADVLEFFTLWDSGDPSVDLTGDGIVDWSDYLVFMNFYEAASPPSVVDFTRDGHIDFRDLDVFLYYLDAFDSRADLTGDGILDFADVLEFLNMLDARTYEV